MKVNSGVVFMAIIAAAAAACLIIIGSIFAYVHYAPKLEDQRIHAELLRLQSAANLYEGRLGSYEGMCADIGIQPGYDCNDSSVAFAISVERADGSFYCMDSSGYFEDQMLPIRKFLSCQQ